jgi:hypothetical protein
MAAAIVKPLMKSSMIGSKKEALIMAAAEAGLMASPGLDLVSDASINAEESEAGMRITWQTTTRIGTVRAVIWEGIGSVAQEMDTKIKTPKHRRASN